MKFTSKTKDVTVAVAIKDSSTVDQYKVQSYVDELAQQIQSHIGKGSSLREVKQFQKIAGILKEDEDQGMPQGTVLEFIYDLGDIEERSGTAEEWSKKIASGYERQGHKDIKIDKLAEDLYKITTSGQTEVVMGPSAPSASDVYYLFKQGDIDEAFEVVEEEGIPNTVEGWVDYFYKKASPKQKAKLVNIYRNQMKEEGVEDAKEFFLDLRDSGDPDAIIKLRDLGQYQGY